MTLLEIKRLLRNGSYAWPGGYPMFFITNDSEVLSFDAVRKNWRNVCEAHICKAYRHTGWFIVACDINWEDTELYCSETSKKIPSAYGED